MVCFPTGHHCHCNWPVQKASSGMCPCTWWTFEHLLWTNSCKQFAFFRCSWFKWLLSIVSDFYCVDAWWSIGVPCLTAKLWARTVPTRTRTLKKLMIMAAPLCDECRRSADLLVFKIRTCHSAAASNPLQLKDSQRFLQLCITERGFVAALSEIILCPRSVDTERRVD